ncbi:hypothetical protein YB2330_002485 [Saitoella coloradoensis]
MADKIKFYQQEAKDQEASAKHEIPRDAGLQPEGDIYKPSEHGGLKQDGTPDKRMKPEHIDKPDEEK